MQVGGVERTELTNNDQSSLSHPSPLHVSVWELKSQYFKLLAAILLKYRQ
jgi:hypothetical protein